MLSKKLLPFCLILGGLINAQNNYYVSLTGNNSNSGSLNSPFKTIFKASQVAQPGDFIYVREGIYRNDDFNDGNIWEGTSAGRIICNGTTNNYITFLPYPNEEVLFEFDANYGVQISNSSYVKFSGFKIKGIAENITQTEAQNNWGLYSLNNEVYTIVGNENLLPLPNGVIKPSYYNGRGLVANSCHHIILSDNVIYNCPSSGIRGEQSDYIQIINNTVYNNTFWTTQGVGAITIAEATDFDNLDANKFIIERNLVFDNENKMISWNPNKSFITYVIDEGSGIFLTRNNQTYLFGKIKISNNVVYNNGASGIMCHYTDRAMILFNSLYFNGANNDGFPGGIGINNTDNVVIANNIIYAKPTKWAIGTTAQPNINYTILNNVVYNENSSQSVFNNLSSGWTNVNPLYINPSSNNLNLEPNSPAINNASNLYVEAKDFYNNDRNDGSNDIGAIEFANPLEITENTITKSLLFPNPALDYVYFVNRINSFLVYDIFGNKIDVDYSYLSNNVLKIDVSNLPVGIYFIIENENSYKFLKQ